MNGGGGQIHLQVEAENGRGLFRWCRTTADGSIWAALSSPATTPIVYQKGPKVTLIVTLNAVNERSLCGRQKSRQTLEIPRSCRRVGSKRLGRTRSRTGIYRTVKTPN